MHALAAYLNEQMDARGWKQADLARASGLTPQTVSNLVTDDRPALVQRPDQATVEALAAAVANGNVGQVLSKVAEAMGLPVETVTVYDASRISDEQLIDELSRRLGLGAKVTRLSEVRRSTVPKDQRGKVARDDDGSEPRGDQTPG